MMLRLQQYQFTVRYKKGKEMYIADTLSHAAILKPTATEIGDVFRLELERMDLKPETLSSTTFQKLQRETAAYLTLKVLYQTVLKGWPSYKSPVPVELRPHWDNRDEISVHEGVLLKSNQTIIPSTLRSEMLEKKHRAHQGVDSSISRARETLFWPSMQAAIRQTCLACDLYTQYLTERPTEPCMRSQEIPTLPWSRISVDLFQLDGKHYLVSVDH